MRFVTHSVDETEALGERLAKRCTAARSSPLRAISAPGKTAFTRGLARGLGIPDACDQPTYTIVNEYTGGRLPLFHFDMYRLGSSDKLFDIGWEDYLQRGGVCAVEWSENVADAMQGRDLGAASAAIRTSSARSSSKEAGWMRILAFETSAKAASVALLEGDHAAGRALSELRPDAQPDAAGIGAAPAGDHGADGKGHRRRRLRGGAGQLYRRAHRRGGRPRALHGGGISRAAAFRRWRPWHGRHRNFPASCARHGRAALPGVSRALPRRERHTDTPVPRLRRFARRGAARTGKLRKTENNGWRWRTVVL